MWRSLFARPNRGCSQGNLLAVVDFPVNAKEVSEYTNTLWGSVSISRSQFEGHYVQTIRNVAAYMQAPEQLSSALKAASEAVRGTMLLKLPYNRSREEGGRYEQLWKYVMFCCHMLKGAGEVQRRFYTADGKRVLIPNLGKQSGYLYDDGGSNARYLVFHNISALLPECSIEWILRDQERGMVEISRAAFGLECFINSSAENAGDRPAKIPDSSIDIPLTPTAVIADKPTSMKTKKNDSTRDTPINKDYSVPADIDAASPADSAEVLAAVATAEPPMVEDDGQSEPPTADTAAGMTTIKGVPPLRVFRKWVRAQKLPLERDSGCRYLECPDAIERFLTERQYDCPASVYQAKLASHGWPAVEIEDTEKLVILLSEKMHV